MSPTQTCSEPAALYLVCQSQVASNFNCFIHMLSSVKFVTLSCKGTHCVSSCNKPHYSVAPPLCPASRSNLCSEARAESCV